MEDVSMLCLDPRLYCRDLSKADKAKHNRVLDCLGDNYVDNRSKYLDAILEKLTPDDVRCLIRAEDELAQLTHFSRIFPTQDTHKYFTFFQQPRYHNLLLDAWEHKYGDCRAAGIDRLAQLCVEKAHLKVPNISQPPSSSATKLTSNSTSSASNSTTTSTVTQKIVNVSMLKAPTGKSMMSTALTDISDNTIQTESKTNPQSNSTTTSSTKRLGVVAKPQYVKQGFAVVAKSIRKSSSVGRSPEPMSITTSSDSRSPSPASDANVENEHNIGAVNENMVNAGGKLDHDDISGNAKSETLKN